MKKPTVAEKKPAAPSGIKREPIKVSGLSVPKKAVEKEPEEQRTSDYRNLRKWTHVKISALLTDPGPEVIRAKIRSKLKGDNSPLTADELLKYMRKIEDEVTEWRRKRQPVPAGFARKKGRPSNDELERRANGEEIFVPVKKAAKASSPKLPDPKSQPTKREPIKAMDPVKEKSVKLPPGKPVKKAA